MAQRTLVNEEECKIWCDEYADCQAAVVSPASWAHRECFLVNTVTLSARIGWSAAIKKALCLGRLILVLWFAKAFQETLRRQKILLNFVHFLCAV